MSDGKIKEYLSHVKENPREGLITAGGLYFLLVGGLYVLPPLRPVADASFSTGISYLVFLLVLIPMFYPMIKNADWNKPLFYIRDNPLKALFFGGMFFYLLVSILLTVGFLDDFMTDFLESDTFYYISIVCIVIPCLVMTGKIIFKKRRFK